jgi:hypothetical protein
VTETRKNFHDYQAKVRLYKILRIADNLAISASPGSFARVKAKKVGLECEADRLVVKPFTKEMSKLIGAPTIVKKEELQMIDLVVSKGNARRLDIVEDKVNAAVKKKRQVAAAISKENDLVLEMSDM